MKRIVVLLIGGLFLASPAAWADKETRKVSCVSTHFFPNNGAQVRWVFLGFTNHDLDNEATIERITFRKGSNGVVLYDQGPNAVFPVIDPPAPTFAALNVTPVPPGEARGFSTITIFGLDTPPNPPGGLFAEVEWSKEGDENLFLVRSVAFTSDRIPLPDEGLRTGNFVTGNRAPCVVVGDGDDD